MSLPLLYARVEGQGQPLLILHGFLGMSDNWKTLSTAYAQMGFAVHALDLRNHGRSFHHPEFNYAVMAEDVCRYMDANGLSQAAVIGHSMGGKLAMHLAVSQPQRIYKLVVADIAPRYYPPHHQNILAALQAVNFAEVTQRQEVEAIMRPFVGDEGTLQFLMKNVYRNTSETLAFRVNLPALVDQIDQIGQGLAPSTHFDGPCLFVRGGRSSYVSAADWEDILRHFPQAQLATIDQAGHWLHADQPQAFLQHSLIFLHA